MFVALAACAVDPGPATLEHRPIADPCGPSPVPAEPSCPNVADDREACTAHADCTRGDGGLCGADWYGGCWCTYDGCAEDADCAEGVCRCGSEVWPHHDCVPANCRTDADCASGRCQASPGFHCGLAEDDEVLAIGGYYCATAADGCNSDDDCRDGERCMFTDERFQCSIRYSGPCD